MILPFNILPRKKGYNLILTLLQLWGKKSTFFKKNKFYLLTMLKLNLFLKLNKNKVIKLDFVTILQKFKV